jgi:hypothetical protein
VFGRRQVGQAGQVEEGARDEETNQVPWEDDNRRPSSWPLGGD